MSQRILRVAALAVVAVTAVRAEAQAPPDIPALLAKANHRIFSARIAGVPLRPGPVTRLGGKGDVELLDAVSYWLRVREEHEARLGIRLNSMSDVVLRKFDQPHDFNDIDSWVWISMALARAASGDFKGGAEMLEIGPMLYLGDVDRARMRSDAVALRIQQYDAENDVRTLLDALRDAGYAVVFAFDPRRPPEPANAESEAHFNRGLILEKLGLYVPAIQSYRQSAERSLDNTWSEEAARRIKLLSEVSRLQRWWEAIFRLETASREGNVRAMREIALLFPERTRVAVEKEYLARWARSALAGEVIKATHDLTAARTIGAALQESLDDSLLADVVFVIDDGFWQKDACRLESIARGHLLYQQANTAAAFEEAAREFRAANSPMAQVASFFAIVAQSDVTHVDESLARLELLKREIPASHRVLHAMVDEAIANCLAERGDLDRARLLYSSAQRVFEVCGELESVARMRTSAAHMLALMGHPVEAWRIRRPALRIADASGDRATMEFVLARTMSDERFNREEWRGLALYGSVLRPQHTEGPPAFEPRKAAWRNPAPFVSTQVQLDWRAGRPLRADVQNDVRFAEGINLCLEQT